MKTQTTGGDGVRIFSRAVEEELGHHLGKWVACTKTRFIAEGDSAADAGTRARQLGFERFLLWRLPAPDEEWYF